MCAVPSSGAGDRSGAAGKSRQINESAFSLLVLHPRSHPVLTTQGSIIPVLDQFMTSLCYQQPCSNESLAQAASAIKTGCQADLQSGNLSPDVVDFAFNTYPTLRETLCLKT